MRKKIRGARGVFSLFSCKQFSKTRFFGATRFPAPVYFAENAISKTGVLLKSNL